MFLPFLAAASVAAALTRRIVVNCCARKPLQGVGWRRVRRLRRVICKVQPPDALCTDIGLAIFQRWHIVALRGCPV